MWKIYRSSLIFDRELRPHLKLPDQAKGSLSAWFEENVIGTIRRKTRPQITGFIQCNGVELCVKKMHIPKMSYMRLLKYSPLRRHNKLVVYKHHKRMFDLDIPVPEPYACLYEHDSQKSRRFSYIIIFQKLEGVEELKHFLAKSHRTIEEKQQLFSRLGRVVANMHKCGYIHMDLGCGNIMINEREIFLIDLDDVWHVSSLRIRRHIIKELIKFILLLTPPNPETRKDIYTALVPFFVEYCKVFGIEPLQLLKKIHHGLDIYQKGMRKSRLKVRRLEFARNAVGYATEFLA